MSYEDSGKTLVINVTSNFAASDTIVVSGLSFKDFDTVCAADNLELELLNDGAVQATDDKTITITLPGPIGFNYLDSPVDLTPASAGSWVDVDASAYIPAGATGVILQVHNPTAATMTTARARTDPPIPG